MRRENAPQLGDARAPALTRRRPEFRYRTSRDRDREALPSFGAPQNVRDVVAKLALRDRGHGANVAIRLRTVAKHCAGGAYPPSMPAPRKPAAPTVPPAGITAHLVEFAAELRAEGIASGTAELLDAVAVLEQVAWTDPADFREALAATLAKSQEDRRVFELVFDRFFFRAAEAAAIREGVREGAPGGVEGGEVDLEALRRQIAAALREGSEGAMRDLARLAIAAFGRRGEGSGVIGVDVQRIRRALALRSEPRPELPATDPRREGVPREALRRFEALLRRELERGQIQRSQTLPASRPLNDLARGLPSGPLQDLEAVHRVVAQLKRRLKTQGHESRGHHRHAHVDVRRTMRASLQTGGVPVALRYKPLRPRRPEIYT